MRKNLIQLCIRFFYVYVASLCNATYYDYENISLFMEEYEWKISAITTQDYEGDLQVGFITYDPNCALQNGNDL